MKDYLSLALLFGFVYLLLPRILNYFSKYIPFKESASLPYHSKFILTGDEYKFYMSFRACIDSNSFIICPKVGLKDLFEVNAGTKQRQKYFGQISQKHIDFLVCDSKLRPLFAVELDDRSHRREEVKKRDEFKNLLFKSAGLPLYRVPSNSSYSEEYIKKYVLYFADPEPEIVETVN